ncbi:unnamed protein product [Effrenium voratum]|nr:unnamed protein product [Effrenium voratum]
MTSNLQQILNMLLVQRQPPSVPESVEPALRSLVVNALQHEAGSRPQVDLVLLQLQAASEPVSKSRFQWIP